VASTQVYVLCVCSASSTEWYSGGLPLGTLHCTFHTANCL